MNSRITKPQLFTKPETYNPIRPSVEKASTLITALNPPKTVYINVTAAINNKDNPSSWY